MLMSGTIVLITSALLAGCSNSIKEGEAYLPNDEIKQGPGIFSGEQGAFYLVGGNSKNSSKAQKPIAKMSTEEATQAIDKKIEQLNQDKIELEALKQQLNTVK